MIFLFLFDRMDLGFFGKSRIQGKVIMSMINRVLLALGVVAVDLAVFFVPLTAVFHGLYTNLQPTLVHGIPEHPGHRAGEKPC